MWLKKCEVNEIWNWRNLELKFKIKAIMADKIWSQKHLKLKKLKGVENWGWRNLKQKKSWNPIVCKC